MGEDKEKAKRKKERKGLGGRKRVRIVMKTLRRETLRRDHRGNTRRRRLQLSYQQAPTHFMQSKRAVGTRTL